MGGAVQVAVQVQVQAPSVSFCGERTRSINACCRYEMRRASSSRSVVVLMYGWVNDGTNE
jgi:hypothetical protein